MVSLEVKLHIVVTSRDEIGPSIYLHDIDLRKIDTYIHKKVTNLHKVKLINVEIG
jgi:hypothetical protein